MANNMNELDPERAAEEGLDPLTDTRTVAQTPTDDSDIIPLPEGPDGTRAGDFDTTTGAAHPSADSGTERRSSGRTSHETTRERTEAQRDSHQQ